MFGENRQANYSIEHCGEDLSILIKARLDTFGFLFVTIWLIGWLLGELGSLRAFAAGNKDALRFLLVWTPAGIAALFVWVWMIFARELVRINKSTLSICREAGRFKRIRNYEVGRIRVLRQAFRTGRAGPLGLCGIEFDYDGKTVGFGRGLGERQSEEILKAVAERFPELSYGYPVLKPA